MPPDVVAHLLAEPGLNITAANKALFSLFFGQATNFEEALDWLRFSFTGDRAGVYMASASTVLVRSMIIEGESIFAPTLKQLWRRFPGAYAPMTPPTLSPPGSNYFNYPPTGRVNELREVENKPTGRALERREVIYRPRVDPPPPPTDIPSP